MTPEERIEELKKKLDVADESKRNMFIHMAKKNENLQSKYEESVMAVSQAEQMLDMHLINLTKAFGEISPNGYTITLPKPRMADLGQYRVSCFEIPETNDYRIVVTEKKNDEQ